MANVTCYVRFYGYLNSDGSADRTRPGHVDLQICNINGVGFSLDSHTQNIDNAVFSYGSTGNNGVGYVRIFADSKTNNNITDDNLLCKYEFTATDTQAMNFRAMLLQELVYVSSGGSNYQLYKLRASHPYATYTDARYNSFCATADWCAMFLGESSLQNYYQQNGYVHNFWDTLGAKHSLYRYFLNR